MISSKEGQSGQEYVAWRKPPQEKDASTLQGIAMKKTKNEMDR